MKRLLGILFRQHQFGELPGAVKNSFGRTLAYVGYINFLVLMAVGYNTTFRDALMGYAPWLSFPMFMGIMVVGVVVVMCLDYKFMMPSEMHFTQKQLWRHMSPIKAELKKVYDKLDKIERKIDKGGA